MTMTAPQIRTVPANECEWADLQLVLADEGNSCQCQFFKLDAAEWAGAVDTAERRRRLHRQTRCGDYDAGVTSGLIAYDGDEPAGWCAVQPRSQYPRLQRMRVPWDGRSEDRADDSVWAVTCFVVRRGYRRRGIARALASAAADFASDHGATAIEGYPMVVGADEQIDGGAAYLYVGTHQWFAAAGYHEVGRPTARRAVMRIDF